MTEPLYDKLNQILDVFIGGFGGRRRIRGIQTILLIRKATMDGRGISISEIRRVTGAPLENLRRNFAREVQEDRLLARADPDDERVTRYLFPHPELELQHTRKLALRLHGIGPPNGDRSENTRQLGGQTIDALNAVLQVFIDAVDGGLRIRGFKMAVVIQQMTLAGEGITASELARRAGAPLETVRRAIKQYTEMGTLRVADDPEDDRANRLHYADPQQSTIALKEIADALDLVDWDAFNIA